MRDEQTGRFTRSTAGDRRRITKALGLELDAATVAAIRAESQGPPGIPPLGRAAREDGRYFAVVSRIPERRYLVQLPRGYVVRVITHRHGLQGFHGSEIGAVGRIVGTW